MEQLAQTNTSDFPFIRLVKHYVITNSFNV
jgi:hypothetical protein